MIPTGRFSKGTRAKPALDVLCFGEVLIDFFPVEPGIALVDCDVFHRHLGGAPANVAVGLAAIGRRPGMMTMVGPDEFGRFVEKRLGAVGVDVHALGRHPSAKTGVTFVSVARDGQRSFLFFRHPSADQMVPPEHVTKEALERAAILHVGSSTLAREPSRSATRRAISLAKELGLVISADPNWRPHLWEDPSSARPLLEELVASADIVKVSDDELTPIVGEVPSGDAGIEEGARRLRALGVTCAIVTLGARGCYFDSPSGTGYLAGQKVSVVDTTGAGDGFVAGLLSVVSQEGGDLAHWPTDKWQKACTRGNEIGAKVVTQLGATAALFPTGR